MPRRAIHAALASLLGLALLAHGYTRPGLHVVEKKEVEVKLPPVPGMPEGFVPAWVEKPPTTQTVIEDVAAVLPEQSAIFKVTIGAIARNAGGQLILSETKEGSPRCPT